MVMESEHSSVTKQVILEKLIELNPEIDREKLEKALETVFDEIALALICGDRVEIRHLGSLVVKKRKGIQARNPKSGAKVQISDRGSLYFRASRELLKHLNQETSNDNAS